jgi:hypothetical protein
MEEARKFPPIKALRDAYRALGNDPTRYRGSSEALVRRITQGKELYRVNTVVCMASISSPVRASTSTAERKRHAGGGPERQLEWPCCHC